jgi:hypothetical protein
MAEVDTPKPLRTRKRSSRAKGTTQVPKPANSVRMKALWQDPAYRERMKQRDVRRSAAMKANPEKFFRRGVPDGMRKHTADLLWEQASALADKVVKKMHEEGMLEDAPVNIPETEAAMAEAALKEACKIALGPSEMRAKMAAINTVLSFTKSKPESKAKLTVSNAEEWLAQVAADAAKDNGSSS